MIRKIIFGNQKNSGTVLLNSILVLAVSIMVVGYSTVYVSQQIDDYRQLDKYYQQQINKEFNKSNKINWYEFQESLNKIGSNVKILLLSKEVNYVR